MSPVRRATAPTAPPPQVEGEVLDIFNLSSYAGGKTIPEGDYAVEFVAQFHQSQDQTGKPVGAVRVGTMLVAYPIQGGDPQEQFCSLGTKAIASWVPTANGKGFAKKAGGAGIPPTNKSNWLYLLDSIKQCLDPGDWDYLQGKDFSSMDGIWMHIKPVPEPEERKGFRKTAATGEAGVEGDDEPRGNGLMPSCTAILPGGKPWLGGGGFQMVQAAPAAAAQPPASAPARRAVVAPRVAAPAPVAPSPAAPAPAPVRRPVAVAPPPVAPPPAEEPAEGEETLADAALGCIGDVLVQPTYARGLKHMMLRMQVHGVATEKYDDQTATDILNTYFNDDAALSSLLGSINYTIKGTGPQRDIVPVAAA